MQSIIEEANCRVNCLIQALLNNNHIGRSRVYKNIQQINTHGDILVGITCTGLWIERWEEYKYL